MISKAKIKYIHSLALKKFRDREGVFVAEGHKLINDLKEHFEIIDEYEGEDAAKASLLDTPTDMLAIFRKRPKQDIAWDGTLWLALDGIQNPGNLGTIIRLADWFGIENIVCSPLCADIYNPKTVQATMGSLARISIIYTDLGEFFSSLPDGTPVYGTLLEGDNIYNKVLTEGGIILMGNEGHGISDSLSPFITEKLLIPNYPKGRPTGDSLNVAIATAIICSEFRRRQ